MVLALTVEEGKRVRVCVQQALGEGIFVGLPLSLSSMRPILGDSTTNVENQNPLYRYHTMRPSLLPLPSPSLSD